MDNGYIKLNRKFFKHFLWEEERVFSKAEAWLDLIRMARYKTKSEVVSSSVVEIQKGELIASRRFLEKRWRWGSTKVTNFLRMLEEQKMIEVKTNHETIQPTNLPATIIKLSNYDYYNGDNDDAEPVHEPHSEPATNQRQTSDKPRTNQIEKRKNIKKEIKENIVVVDTLIDLNRGIVKGEKWKTDFEDYKSGLRHVYSHLIRDEGFIAEQQKFHPGVNIKLTLEKACTAYWATEAGWKNKKGKRTKSIDWRQTLINALSQPHNKVYEQRNNTTAGRVAEKRESLESLERAALECLFGGQGQNGN